MHNMYVESFVVLQFVCYVIGVRVLAVRRRDIRAASGRTPCGSEGETLAAQCTPKHLFVSIFFFLQAFESGGGGRGKCGGEALVKLWPS